MRGRHIILNIEDICSSFEKPDIFISKPTRNIYSIYMILCL